MSKREIRLSVLELEKLGVTLAFPQYPDTKAEENSRRLTACWNACEGISTENLEYGLPVKDLVQQCNEAIWQRDELLAALEAALEEIAQHADLGHQIDNFARKAIGSVKGGAA